MIPSRRSPTVHACTIWHHERIGALVRALHYEDTKRVTKRQIWSFRPNAGLIALFPEITRPHDASRRVCPLDTATAQKDCFQSGHLPAPTQKLRPRFLAVEFRFASGLIQLGKPPLFIPLIGARSRVQMSVRVTTFRLALGVVARIRLVVTILFAASGRVAPISLAHHLPLGADPERGQWMCRIWTFEHLAESWAEVKKRGRDQRPIAFRGCLPLRPI